MVSNHFEIHLRLRFDFNCICIRKKELCDAEKLIRLDKFLPTDKKKYQIYIKVHTAFTCCNYYYYYWQVLNFVYAWRATKTTTTDRECRERHDKELMMFDMKWRCATHYNNANGNHIICSLSIIIILLATTSHTQKMKSASQ